MSVLRIACQVHFGRGRRSHKELRPGHGAEPQFAGKVPRVARMMALAIHLDRLLASRQVENYSDLARRGHVSRMRISQIMSLLNLAPNIQETVLFLPATYEGRDLIQERHLHRVARVMNWKKQRQLWKELQARL